MSQEILLLPYPQHLTRTGGQLSLENGKLIALDTARPADLWFTAQQAQQALSKHAGAHWDIVGGTHAPHEQIGVTISLSEAVGKPEGYRLSISPQGIQLVAADKSGAFYGVMTLNQLVRQFGQQLPGLHVDDYPDLPRRGVMLDISRDKVPTMETLYGLVDKLAAWKVNEFQLYTEHTFAYRDHREVWSQASPMTAEEILALDAYCRQRYIQLVPNQNSFGHMQRWFKHPRYRPLAEVDGPVTANWGEVFEIPFSLAPANPNTLPFLEGLFDELLPNFTARSFNVGCDETFDLGLGQSKALCETKGKGRVYLDFLLEIYARVKRHGRTMQFWADIMGHYPELIPDLPRDVVALEWGYDADHPFDEKCAVFANAGIPFYVCPGTSAWASIAGRTDTAISNIRNAVENGLKHGALGILNTEWGDRGHWQPLPFAYLGFIYGAALGWAFEANKDTDIQAVLSAFAFEDKAQIMGKLAYNLGMAYQQTGAGPSGGSVLFWAYHFPTDVRQEISAYMAPKREAVTSMPHITARLRDTLAFIDREMADLSRARMASPDAGLIVSEFECAADMLRYGAKRLLVMMGDSSVSEAALRADMGRLIERYKAQWLARNRPGGLEDSTALMRELA